MADDGQSVIVQRVEPSSNPVQDEDLDQYGDELAGLTIVDVDVHVDDTLMFMLDYMEGHFRKRMETVLQADFKGEPGNSLRNMIAHIAWLGSSYDKPPRAKLATKEDLLARMQKGIIDYSILFPSELLPIGYLPEPEWAAALATAYNQYMVDAYRNLDGVKIAIVVAPQHPERAAQEIESHAAHPDVVSVCIPDVGVNPPIGDEKVLADLRSRGPARSPYQFPWHRGPHSRQLSATCCPLSHAHAGQQHGLSVHIDAADHVGGLRRHSRQIPQSEIRHSRGRAHMDALHHVPAGCRLPAIPHGVAGLGEEAERLHTRLVHWHA